MKSTLVKAIEEAVNAEREAFKAAVVAAVPDGKPIAYPALWRLFTAGVNYGLHRDRDAVFNEGVGFAQRIQAK